MSEFTSVWYDEVRPIAKKCILEPEYIKIMHLDSFKLTEKETKFLKDINLKYSHAYGMYYISNMIDAIDSCIENNKESDAYIYVNLVHSMLSSSMYFEKFFKNNSSSEEWQTKLNLKNGLSKLIDIINNK